MWDVARGNKLQIFREAKQPTQGVAWDPLGSSIATLSMDRWGGCPRRHSWSVGTTHVGHRVQVCVTFTDHSESTAVGR